MCNCIVDFLQVMGYTTASVFVFVFALLCEAAVSCGNIPSSGYAGAQRKPKGYGSAKRAIIIGRSI